MVLTARGTLDPRDVIAPVSAGLFGSFVEHMGRCVYGGIFEPAHPTADAHGFRTDVLQLVRELGVTLVRYPGGNFASGYRWEDGVGPVEARPVRLDLAWHSRETNAFGLGEFMRWVRAAGVEPMLTLNLGTRGMGEALELLEYANHPRGSALADRRRDDGHAEPFAIRHWCLGNELDGPWQLGHKTAAEYGRSAAETARAMRQYDPHLQLVVAGSSGSSMPTFGEWERTVLAATWELVDEISLHAYYEEDDDLGSFLASGVALDRYIEEVASIADDVVAGAGGSRSIRLAVDEWNVWYLRRHQERFQPLDWPVAPRISEDAYTVADAVVVGSLLIALLRHADRVSTACLAQLVNVIAPIKTEPLGPAWREATFYPFALTAAHRWGSAVPLHLVAPTVATRRHGEVPVIDAVAVVADDQSALSVFMVNRHPAEPTTLEVDLLPAQGWAVEDAVVLADGDVHAANTREQPDRVHPVELTSVTIADARLRLDLPPVSWAHVRLTRRGEMHDPAGSD